MRKLEVTLLAKLTNTNLKEVSCYHISTITLFTQHQLIDKLRHLTGRLLYRLIVNYINAIQYNELISSFKTKNNKLKRLIQAKSPRSNFKVPIGNLSSDKLSVKERKQLEMELEFSFFDKNKHLNKQVAPYFKTLLHRASDSVHYQNLEDFHEFLRAYTDIFTNNVYPIKDFTYSILKNIIKTDKIVRR